MTTQAIPEGRDEKVLAWIDGVPVRWSVEVLGSQFAESRTSNKGMKESLVLSLSYGRVVVRDLEGKRGLLPESFETYQVLEPGDIVIRPTDLQNDRTSLRVGQTWQRGIITSAYLALRPTRQMTSRYGAYLLKAYDYMKVFYGFGSGLRQNLDYRHIKYLPVPVPSRDEQDSIVRYLDHAEMRIARAIQAKQEQLRRFNELRTSKVAREILGKAPEKVLSPYLPHRVPDHWKIVPLWSVAPLRSDSGHNNEQLLSVYLNRGVILYSESGGQVHKPSANLSAYQLVQPVDLVLNNQQAWRGSGGVSTYRGIVSPAYVVAVLDSKIDSLWANFLFRSPAMVDQFVMASRGVGSIQRQLHMQSLRRVLVPLPPMNEQRECAEKLLNATRKLDEMASSIQREIDLLREYRTRLIADVVTGKKDVRGEAASLPDVDPLELARVLSGTTAIEDNVEEEVEANGD